LRVWIAAGLFGSQKAEQGRKRVYTLEDLVIGRIIREILDLTKSRTLMIADRGKFVEEFRTAFAFPISTALESGKATGLWLVLSWQPEEEDYLITVYHGTQNNFPSRNIMLTNKNLRKGQPMILLPVWEVIEEVLEWAKRKFPESFEDQ
jgi:hypothetical protein